MRKSSNSNHLTLVLSAISNMDTVGLYSFLLSECLYQGVNVLEFAKSMSDTFKKYKRRGDTTLQLHRGKCPCPRCDDPNLFGYLLVGNRSKSHLALMFRLDTIGVTSIYNCKCYYETEELILFHDFQTEYPVETEEYFELITDRGGNRDIFLAEEYVKNNSPRRQLH